MASGKLLRQLIKSGTRGDTSGFRAASEAVIKDEREKNHHLLANDLERLLYGDQATVGNVARKLQGLPSLPTNKDNGLALLEERTVIQDSAWSQDEHKAETEPYALAVLLADREQANAQLYAQVRVALQARTRAQARARA